MINFNKDFSFGDHAPKFDAHIRSSIPGYKEGLLQACVSLSRRFIQPETRVLDVGCSTGHLLASIRRANQATRPDVQYLGIDIEPGFSVHWDRLRATNLAFEVADARTYQGLAGLSLALSLFTVQFIRAVDKLPLLKRIYDGLVDGGALVIAEKTLAETARLQDALTFPYYDYKLGKGFSPQDILDKERRFREIEAIWRNYMFVGLLALK
jgi:tRNA (cmo5U34)-methyltransferase